MNFLIQNGMVYNPADHTMQKKNIALRDGIIADPVEGMEYRQVIDADGCIVTCGLIDFHVHFMPVKAGVNPDASSFCCGITTAVDAGSAGSSTFPWYYKTTVATSAVRILNDLLVASGGQVSWDYHESINAENFNEEDIVQCFETYSENLVGLKTRFSEYVIGDEEAAERSLERTIEIAERVGTRVIVHVTKPALPMEKIAQMLRPGDVICHIYQGFGRTILDENGVVYPEIKRAHERGVLFDACHGRGNYSIAVCRKAMEQGILPDIISSDNNSGSSFLEPLHSLPKILSKYLDYGMKIEDVLDCATKTPALAIDRPELGSMDIGTPADVAILRLENRRIHHEDILGEHFDGTQILVPQMTFKDGICMYCQSYFA